MFLSQAPQTGKVVKKFLYQRTSAKQHIIFDFQMRLARYIAKISLYNRINISTYYNQ